MRRSGRGAKLKGFGVFAAALFGTAAVLWGAEEAARSRPAPVIWHTVTVREPAPQPVVKTPLDARGIDLEQAIAWDPSPSRLAAFALGQRGDLTVFNLRTGARIARLDPGPGAAKAVWVSDRLLLILTRGNALETYDVWNHVLRWIAALEPPAGTTCRAIAWSGYTNDLFVIFSASWGNEVYEFDTNEHMTLWSLGHLDVEQAYYGATNLTLYVVDAAHRLWSYRAGVLRLVATHVALIRGAGNTVYCAVLGANGEAVEVRAFDGQAWRTVCRLKSSAPVSNLIVDHAGNVYIVSRGLVQDAKGRAARAEPGAFFFPSQSADAALVVKGQAYGVTLD
ncbi:hypothetical protein [Alicyclobacillus vulcanalis]|uniref:PQQ-like domain-containing protein n=1 Tax=Alicyclobacillus vulcanalis TaxID=252246 RepID=A0A1N7N511_9BACL|nr:hypothetical protein [Alicyclobacillus vulcanalis]SIS93493.1 hypothetical protein SAMN05421799_10781 [Alicyclobacillus vulcanalis]